MSALRDADEEGYSRLAGLAAVMALPPVRVGDGTYRRRVVEIEVTPDSERWVEIEGIAIEIGRIICWTGSNGSRQNFEYKRGEGIPRWRTPQSIFPRTRSQ